MKTTVVRDYFSCIKAHNMYLQVFPLATMYSVEGSKKPKAERTWYLLASLLTVAGTPSS